MSTCSGLSFLCPAGLLWVCVKIRALAGVPSGPTGSHSTLKGREKIYGTFAIEYVKKTVGWRSKRRHRSDQEMLGLKRATRRGRNQLLASLKILTIILQLLLVFHTY
jgi:hypothetical protein